MSEELDSTLEGSVPVTESQPASADEMIGRVIDERYRIEAPLGEGGLGRVYKARHLTLGRMVALKVLLAQYEEIDSLKKRFEREAAALAALSHPNIVTVTDFGVDGQNPFLVMELLAGQDLSDLLSSEEPLEPSRGIRIVCQALRGLTYAHEQGLVHRDLKPHNIFVRDLGDADHVHVLDFGLARFTDGEGRNGPAITRQGALIGTPAYMAPEQASGEQVDARADIYAMGCVLFEVLTGRRVFAAKSSGDILRAHLLEMPPTLAAADASLRCDPAIEAIVARCLAKSPADRFATARAFQAALDELPSNAVERVGPRQPRSSPSAEEELSATAVGTPKAKAAERIRKEQPSAAEEEGSARPSLPRRSRRPVLVTVAIAALVAAAVAFAWLSSSPEERESGAHPVNEPPRADVDQTAGYPRAFDPLTGPLAEGVLREARSTLAATDVERDATNRERLRRALRTYVQNPESDRVRGHLLSGGLLARDEAWAEAFDHYREALRLDPSARAGNLLRADLLRMACSEDLGRGARALIARRYPRDELRDFPGYEGGAVCPELSALATRVSNN